MGGPGSGTWWRWSKRDTCESYSSISIAYLRANDLLKPGKRATLSWSRFGQPVSSIGIEYTSWGLALEYNSRSSAGGEWRQIREVIPWDRTEQPFGGTRLWFRCLSCNRRCGVVYGGQHYRCRKCWQLSYASQQEAYRVPGLARARTIRRKLGGSEGIDDAFPKRPKGMHQRTYQRLQSECFDVEGNVSERVAALIGAA